MNYAEFLYEAVASPSGIVVDTDDVQFLRQKLYATRRELADPSFDCLSFVVSPFNGVDLWIVKHGGNDAEE